MNNKYTNDIKAAKKIIMLNKIVIFISLFNIMICLVNLFIFESETLSYISVILVMIIATIMGYEKTIK